MFEPTLTKRFVAACLVLVLALPCVTAAYAEESPPSSVPASPPVEAEPSPPAEPEPSPPTEAEPSPPSDPEPSPPSEAEASPPVEPEPSPSTEAEVSPPADPEPLPPSEAEVSPSAEPEPSPPAEVEPALPVEAEPSPLEGVGTMALADGAKSVPASWMTFVKEKFAPSSDTSLREVYFVDVRPASASSGDLYLVVQDGVITAAYFRDGNSWMEGGGLYFRVDSGFVPVVGFDLASTLGGEADPSPDSPVSSPHPFWTTDFEDFTVSEGLLFLIFCLLALFGVVKIFR